MPSLNSLPTFFGRATAILGEHAKLHVTIKQLDQLCERVMAGGQLDTAEWIDRLRELEDELHAHFAAEEGEGYFGTLVAGFPALAPRISELKIEHGQMLLGVHRLVSPPDLLSDLPKWAAQLRTLIVRFRAHEHTENLLLQAFFEHSESEQLRSQVPPVVER